jgi:hypothetical protein
VLVMV